jgi:hypothetical protein
MNISGKTLEHHISHLEFSVAFPEMGFFENMELLKKLKFLYRELAIIEETLDMNTPKSQYALKKLYTLFRNPENSAEYIRRLHESIYEFIAILAEEKNMVDRNEFIILCDKTVDVVEEIIIFLKTKRTYFIAYILAAPKTKKQ